MRRSNVSSTILRLSATGRRRRSKALLTTTRSEVSIYPPMWNFRKCPQRAIVLACSRFVQTVHTRRLRSLVNLRNNTTTRIPCERNNTGVSISRSPARARSSRALSRGGYAALFRIRGCRCDLYRCGASRPQLCHGLLGQAVSYYHPHWQPPDAAYLKLGW